MAVGSRPRGELSYFLITVQPGGPEGVLYYWHDLRKDPLYFWISQKGGESLMIWGEMSFYGLYNIVVVRGNQKSANHCHLLRRHLLLFAAETVGETWGFRKIVHRHIAVTTRKAYWKRNIDALPW